MKLLRILSTLLLAGLFLMLMLVIAIQADSSQATPPTAALLIKSLMAEEESGPMPDLIVESFTLVPANPYTDQPAEMTARVRNIGTADAPGIRLYLYINPEVQPPTSVTTPTVPLIYGIPVSPGESITLEYANFTFTEPGCQNILYAWVDPLERIDESDEANNLREIPVCVENEVLKVADQYENDNTCDENQTTGIATDGTVQVHNFIVPPDSEEVDVDWVRFDAMQGRRYTIIAAGTGEDAWPILSLGDSCDLEGSFGTTSRLSFVARSDGWHYVKVENNNLDGTSVERSYYEFSVREELEGQEPNITAISPPSGVAELETDIVITGTDFIFPPEAEICPYEVGSCSPSYECAQLLNTSWVSYQQLLAIVPPALQPGDYCITVTNPEGQTDVLTNTFTIQPSKNSTPTPTATPGPIHLPLVLRQEPPPPTEVLTPTPTNTPSATNTPTATPIPPITNGDFESNNFEGWSSAGQLDQTVTSEDSYTGNFSALLGNPQLGNGAEGNIPAGNAYIEQQVQVPSDGTPQLSFWYNLTSYDVLRGEGSGKLWDSFDVTINGNSDPVFQAGNPAKVLEANYPRYESYWLQHTIDLSAYAGQTITIRFAAWNREYDGTGQDYANTWVYVDDVMVIP